MNSKAKADGLAVLCAGGFRHALETIAPSCPSLADARIEFATPARLAERLLAREPFDLVIAVSAALMPVEKAGLIRSETRQKLAGTRLALCVPSSSPLRSDPSLESFSQVLDGLVSLALSDPKIGTPLATNLLAAADRHDLSEQIRQRARYVAGPGTLVAQTVSKGEAAAGVALASEIVNVPGAAIGGFLPDPLQQSVDFHIFVPSYTTMEGRVITALREISARAVDGLQTLGFEA